MLPSNRKHLSVFSLILALSLTGCTLSKPQDRDDGNVPTAATFTVEHVEASVTNQISHSEFSLPVAKVYSFKACMKESQHSRPILNHNFEIEGGAEVTSVTSDGSGCVIWSEKISYNHLAPAQWVETLRTIRAQGLQKGQRQIALGLNPWENKAESLSDKEIKNLQQGEAAQAALNADTAQGVWIDDLRLTVDEKKISDTGVTLNFEIRSIPATPLTKSTGDKIWEPLTKGRFEAEIVLISVLSENQKEVRRAITKPVKIKEVKIANNALLIETPIVLAPASRYGQIQLGLKVTPLDGPKNLAAFQGVFNVAEYDAIKGSFFSRVKNEFQKEPRDLSIDKYLTEGSGSVKGLWSSDPNAAQDPSNTSGFQQAQVRVQQPLTAAMVGFKGGKTSSLMREKIFTITACMIAPIDSKPLRAQKFQVQKTNGSSETLNSNDHGCITWEDSIQFQYLDKECWVQKQIHISNSTLGMNQSLTVQINPWAEGPNSFRDVRNIGSQQLLCADGKSEITVVAYSFKKERMHYPIDSALNIKVQKEGILSLQARLTRPSLVEATNFETPYALPPGRYLLRWAIVDQEVEDYSKAAGSILQVQEKTIDIKADGVINGTLTFESEKLRSLGNANSLLVELTPEGKKDNFNITTFKATLLLSEGTDAGQFAPVAHAPNESLILKLRSQLNQDIEARKAVQKKMMMKETFAANEHLSLLNLNDETSTQKFRQALSAPLAWQPGENPYLKTRNPVTTQDLNQWLTSGKISSQMARTLCNFWFADQLRRPLNQPKPGQKVAPFVSPPELSRMQRSCVMAVNNPKQTFDIQYRYFLKDVKQVIQPDGKEDMVTETKDLSFGYSFSFSQAHDNATSKSMSADAGVSLKLPTIIEFLSPVSLSLGSRVAVAKAESDRHGRANSTNISSGQALALEKLSFKIKSSGYEKCAVIRLKAPLLNEALEIIKPHLGAVAQPAAALDEISRGYMICSGGIQNRNVVFSEDYYILNQRLQSQVIDNTSNQGRPLFMMIRGLSDFRRMMTILNGQLTAPNSPEQALQTHRTAHSEIAPLFNHGFPAYPGTYVADE